MQNIFYSNGKLLLTAEYGVLDGAAALAVPTTVGQNLSVTPHPERNRILWESYNNDKSLWFRAILKKEQLLPDSFSNKKMAQRLVEILMAAKDLNPKFLKESGGLHIKTELGFDRNWGLGSSSTLINNIAQWAAIDPYLLLHRTFGGSGYDIACTKHNQPIVYTLKNGIPKVEETTFHPPFVEQLYFVYLNKKQDSREAIENYRTHVKDSPKLVGKLTELTHSLLKADTLSAFQSLLNEHEAILSKVLHIPTVKDRLFADYGGALKSLGGWGGDFILAAGNEKTPAYFKDKGFSVVIPYKDMVLQPHHREGYF